MLQKPISLLGDQATIDATGLQNGVLIQGTAAAGSLVRGFTVQNAIAEGVLLQNTSRINVIGNTVQNNDQGIFLPASQQTGECAAAGLIPGDCGEGLHLWSVTASNVLNNTVVNNAGGILLTDETGPTARNLVAQNTVNNNAYDCGITIAGHNPGAAPGGVPAPAVAGIYSNTIAHNTANNNGVLGQGAGILLAGGPPGTAVYNNMIVNNNAAGNGLAGITLHSHAPGQDLNGNALIGNHLGTNNVDGDEDFAVPDTQTTGIMIASAVPGTLTSITVVGNHIADDHFGIWTLHAPAISAAANHFVNVQVPVQQQ